MSDDKQRDAVREASIERAMCSHCIKETGDWQDHHLCEDCVVFHHHEFVKRSSCRLLASERFPDPLQIGFGFGRINMKPYTDDTGAGMILKDSGQDHPIGHEPDGEPEPERMPEKGEVFLHFANMESALAFRKTLDEAIDLLGKPGETEQGEG